MNQIVRKEVEAIVRAVSEPDLGELPPVEAYEDFGPLEPVEVAKKSVPEEVKRPDPIPFSFVNLRDAVRKPKIDLDFIMKGFLKNSISLLVGTGGIGKSSLLLGVAFGLANPELDVYRLNIGKQPRKVMILFAEDDAVVVNNRVHDFCKELKLDAKQVDEAIDSGAIMFTCDSDLMKHMKDIDWLHQLRATIVEHGVDLIVFDTWSVLSGIENENDNAEAKQILLNLKNHILMPKEDHKVSIMLAHHTNESGDIRGAKALKANTRTTYIMRAPIDDEVEQLLKREEDPRDYVRLELNKCNYDRTGPLAWFKRGDHGVLHVAEDEITESLNLITVGLKARFRGRSGRRPAAAPAASVMSSEKPEEEGDGYANW